MQFLIVKKQAVLSDFIQYKLPEFLKKQETLTIILLFIQYKLT